MKVDLYTKGVLTVIAACLLWLTFDGSRLLPAVQAQQSQANRVVLSGWVDSSGVERQFGGNTAFPVVIVNMK